MFYRRSTELAIQAAALLALEPHGTPRRVRDLAAAMKVPATYLTKILQQLTRVGLLQSVRGPGGGVQLARPPQEIKLWDVMTAAQPLADFERCFLGLGKCNDIEPCPVHNVWGPVRKSVLESFQTITLWEVAQSATRKDFLGPNPKGNAKGPSAGQSLPLNEPGITLARR